MHKIGQGTLKNMPEPIFDIFEKNIKNRFGRSTYKKNCILDITHHLRGATEFSWGQ